MNEKELQQTVLEMFGWHSWLTYHTYDSRMSQPGFPDVVAVKGHRVVWMELKSKKGKIRPEQRVWLDQLVLSQSEVYLVRPSDMDTVEDIARGIMNLRCHWNNVKGEA